jgi:hypothetical protein
MGEVVTTRTGVSVLTPAKIAIWEAGLTERTQLCAHIAGWPKATLTLYAGPDGRGGKPVAVITGIESATYVSRPSDDDTESWIRSVLNVLGEHNHSLAVVGN